MPAKDTFGYIAIATAIALLINNYGRNFIDKIILPPLKAIMEFIYRRIAPKNPFSISVRSYRKHVMRSELSKIETVVGPALDVPLQRAYAPLKLISELTESSVDLFEQTVRHDRYLVLGGPGSGKTTLMKGLLVSVLCKQTNTRLDNSIPIFVKLRNLAINQHSVKEAIVSSFSNYHFPQANRFVDACLAQGKMIIILDGLDEVGVNREFVVSKIREFCEFDNQREDRNRVIVTCREQSYRSPDLRDVISNIVRVEPFASGHIRQFLRGWPPAKNRAAISLYAKIQSDLIIRDICKNPLMLTILTGLYMGSDKFALPTSRTAFYQAAIEELMINRPNRRGNRQEFDWEKKLAILASTCLERLESAGGQEDPEEFSAVSLGSLARLILGLKSDSEVQDFLYELAEINGVIKQSRPHYYTCSHRTFQEYLAARDAMQNRSSNEVVKQFSSRDDLIEVLYYYCGMVDNIPQLNGVLKELVQNNRLIEAAKCLLYMKLTPDESIIIFISKRLLDTINTTQNVGIELELLSSLSQKQDRAFDAVRADFSVAIDNLMKSKNDKGISAFESALSASPEIARRVIPGLLNHESPERKRIAVKLLRNIASPESFDELVQLVVSPDKIVCCASAIELSEMIVTHKEELISRSELLPEIKDRRLWPFEQLFPGRLAIPMAHAIAGLSETNNRAINAAARAICALKSKDPNSRRYLSQWSRLLNLFRLRYWKNKIAAWLDGIGYIVAATIAIISMAVILISLLSNSLLIIAKNPFHSVLQSDAFADSLESVVADIDSIVRASYPPNASGFSRLLPRYWTVEPVLPDSIQKPYVIIMSSKIVRPFVMPKYAIFDKDVLIPMRHRLGNELVDRYYSLLISTNERIAAMMSTHGIVLWIRPSLRGLELIGMIIIVLIAMKFPLKFRSMLLPRRSIEYTYKLRLEEKIILYFVASSRSQQVAIFVFAYVYFLGTGGIELSLAVAVGWLSIIPVGAGIVEHLPLPHKELMRVADDLVIDGDDTSRNVLQVVGG